MTKDELINMAKEAGLLEGWGADAIQKCEFVGATNIEKFANLVARHTQEQCAKVCEAQRTIDFVNANLPSRVKHEPANIMADSCASAIRNMTV